MDIEEKIEHVRKNLSIAINNAPNSPGVYSMRDKEGIIVYIGKAKSLRKRLRSHFSKSANFLYKQNKLISNVKGIDYITTQTETQALLLEARLIKENMPKYNVSLRDDKSFPFVKITNEDFPVVSICRPKAKGKDYFFGPYTSATLLREALKVIRKVFPYRTCRVMPKNVCLLYHLNLCSGPCIRAISKKRYSIIIKNISLILQAKQEDLLRQLSNEMQEKAKKRDFEEAALVRDQIKALSSIYKDAPGSSKPYRDESEELKYVLDLSKMPRRIEAFDISNIFGKEAVGSMVSFYQASPDKSNYRRFKIKDSEGIDDYKMLSEIINRRYRRLKEEDKPLPDLIVIDGGKGQLSAAKKELDALNLDIPVISIAKEKEIIFSTRKKGPIILPFESVGLNLVRRVRDEAHRFALAYHHVLRRKAAFKS